jgi:YesN/AraC family two-component response regulator
MPGMSGIELIKKVKAESPETVGLLLTGNGEFYDAEAVDHKELIFKLLSKPCQTSDLISAIEEALERYRLNTGVVTS